MYRLKCWEKKLKLKTSKKKPPGLRDLEVSFNFVAMGLRWLLKKYVKI